MAHDPPRGLHRADLLYSLASARLERTVVTEPTVFTAAGIGLFLLSGTVPAWEGDREVFRRVAELGLVLLPTRQTYGLLMPTGFELAA